MEQLDWVSTAPARPFKDIRNTRPSVAQQKAEMLLRLGDLINKIPPNVKGGGSINDVRNWRIGREAAAKVAKSTRSSTAEITSAISNMERLWGV